MLQKLLQRRWLPTFSNNTYLFLCEQILTCSSWIQKACPNMVLTKPHLFTRGLTVQKYLQHHCHSIYLWKLLGCWKSKISPLFPLFSPSQKLWAYSECRRWYITLFLGVLAQPETKRVQRAPFHSVLHLLHNNTCRKQWHNMPIFSPNLPLQLYQQGHISKD